MNFEDLKNPELQEKLKSAKSAEELVALMREQGVELTDEQLDAVSGGKEWYQFCNLHHQCPRKQDQPA